MGKTLIIVVLFILSLGSVGLYFNSQSEIEQADQENQKLESDRQKLEDEKDRLNEAAKNAEREMRAEAKRAKDAIEAARMAEEKALKEEQARQASVDALNKQLVDEAAQLKTAQDAIAQLEDEKAKLIQAQKDLQKNAVAASGEPAPLVDNSETDELIHQLNQEVDRQKSELARLEEENKLLQEKYEAALKDQPIAAPQIVEEYSSTVPYAGTHSANDKRKTAKSFMVGNNQGL